MESGKIPDSAIKASSYYPGYFPKYVKPGSDYCWNPATGQEQNSWIQIDLGNTTIFTGLETKGCKSDWTETYSVSFSIDGKRWFKYKENGAAKVCMK